MEAPGTLEDFHWKTRYRSSKTDLLHDFYVPALSRSVTYDRVAGYFRSSSLAVASQGFSALVKNEGKIRLVVGADLNPDDAKAILEGDASHLANKLSEELSDPNKWPESVTNGVTLLSWMVRHGHLELRVAFRVNVRTGEPMSFDSREDGYVHEKWAVFKDREGKSLLMSGSLNESKTALVFNAENINVHCDWWSEHDARRVRDASRDFEAMWEDDDPGLRVMPLPEAVKKKLVNFSADVVRPLEIDGSSELPPLVPEPSAMERLRFAILRDAPKMPNGRFVGMETAPIEPWPHQFVVAHRLIEAWPFSFLLCDEVGLGKTIENGLAFRSLYLSGIATKILIAPPASLTRQWQNELKDKFLLPFALAVSGPKPRHEYIHPRTDSVDVHSLFEADLCIVSTGLIARKDRKQEVKASGPWDIVLVDEAHYARRKNSRDGVNGQPLYGDLYKAIDDILRKRAKSLLLATATPMQIDPIEVYDLLRLSHRVGAFQEDPELTRLFYESLGKIVRRQRVEPRETEFLRKAMIAIRFEDPLLERYIADIVVEPRTRTDAKRWLEQGTISPSSLRRLTRVLFSGAPLSRVMMRHTRSLLEIYRKNGELSANLARRTILPIPHIEFTTQEKQAYEQLEVYCKELEQRLSDNKKMRTSTAFFLSFLRLRFASSLYAIARTLQRRLERVKATLAHLRGEQALDDSNDESVLDALLTADEVEDDQAVVGELLKDRDESDLEWELEILGEMLSTSLYDVAATSSKMQELLKSIEHSRKDPVRPGRIKQTVIFTRFYDTLRDIVSRLRKVNPHFAIGTYSGHGGEYTDINSGAIIGISRDETKHRFLRGQIDILVCTDAAAEGLNLQTADLLINFDLPWNPAKVEQRIGRIDRIGQVYKDIYVLNLCYLGSAEEIVYGRLLSRLARANDVVGRQQISMLPVSEEDFLELAEGKLTEKELTKRAQSQIAENQRKTDAMEIPAADLYGIYQQLSKQLKNKDLPATLPDVWNTLSNSPYLQSIGCESIRVDAENNRWVISLKSFPGIPDGTALTTDRKLYDEGVDELEGLLHFASYGDSVFDSVIAHVCEFDLPGCVRRLFVKPANLDFDYVAYLVAYKSESGTQLKLVTRLSDLSSIELDGNAVISEADEKPFVKQLQLTANKEFEYTIAAQRIEHDNQKRAIAQAVMALGIILGMLRSWKKSKRLQGDFKKDITELETFIVNRMTGSNGINVHSVPKPPMDTINHAVPISNTFFEAKPKIAEDEWYFPNGAPQLFYSGLAATRRLADRMKKAKTELSTDAVMSRMESEMNKMSSLL